MKKYTFTLMLIILGTACLLPQLSFGQSPVTLIVKYEGKTISSGAVIPVHGTHQQVDLTSGLSILNNANEPVEIKVTKSVLNSNDNPKHFFAINGNAYPGNTSLNVTIEAGQTNNSFEAFYNPETVQGISIVSYLFTDQNNPENQVKIDFLFTTFSFKPSSKGAALLGNIETESNQDVDQAVVAAFSASGSCVGIAPLIPESGKSYMNMTIYGNDGYESGLTENESFVLKLFSSNNGELIGTYPEVNGWYDNHFLPIPAWNNPETIYTFQDSFIVTATASEGGTVQPATQTSLIGDNVNVMANPLPGYEFSHWSVTGIEAADSLNPMLEFIMPSNNVSAHAVFRKILYIVSATAQTGGTVAPANQIMYFGDAVVVEAIVNNGFTFNGWEATGVSLTNEMANPLNFTMPNNNVSLHAKFTSGCSSNWSPPSNLQFNMQLVAQILIDGQISLNPNDVLGAFVGDECRGIANPNPSLDGIVFLTIGSDVAFGEQVELKIWNSNSCSECNAIPGFEFVNQGEIGTFLEPYQVRCGAIQDITFGQGYTWFSLNVNPGNMSPASLFTALTPCYDDRVIGQTSFALYTGSAWVGSLTNLGMDKMYRMKLCSSQSVSLMGDAAALNPINLNAGYTWLGYQPQQCQTVSATMAGLSPGPSYDDRVIGQSSFALFTGSTWVGSLTQMCPGKGYVVKLANAQTLTYPAPSAKSSSGEPEIFELVSPTGIYPAVNHQHSMMVVAKLQLPDGMISLNEKDVVYAYINGEVRGIGNPMPDADGAIFMSISDNEDLSKPISFMVWLDDLQELLPLNETLSFEPLSAVGNLDNPFILTIGEMVDMDETEAGIWIGEPYPNPFNEQTTVPYFLKEAAELSFSIYDSRGVKVKAESSFASDKGHQQFSIERIGLAKGVYVLKVNISNYSTTVIKMTKLIIN